MPQNKNHSPLPYSMLVTIRRVFEPDLADLIIVAVNHHEELKAFVELIVKDYTEHKASLPENTIHKARLLLEKLNGKE